MYHNNIQTNEILSSSKVFQNIMSVEPQLAAWEAGLPPQVRLQCRATMIEVTTDKPSIDITMSLVLTLRYLHTRMLLHRPILTCFLQHGRATENVEGEWHFLMNFGRASVEMCLSAALDTLDILQNSSRSSAWPPMLTTWWFQIYYGKLIPHLSICSSCHIPSTGTLYQPFLVFSISILFSLSHLRHYDSRHQT